MFLFFFSFFVFFPLFVFLYWGSALHPIARAFCLFFHQNMFLLFLAWLPDSIPIDELSDSPLVLLLFFFLTRVFNVHAPGSVGNK